VVDADRDALLVLSHAWEDGWHATVDGRSAPVLRTNGLVLGVVVPEGRHVVQVGFRAPGLRAGTAISGTSLAVLLGAPSLVAWLRRRRAVAVVPVRPDRVSTDDENPPVRPLPGEP
jgi:hypothetical protein